MELDFEAAANDPSLLRPYLLVVEDHLDMRTQLIQLLQAGFPSHDVQGVGNGEAALHRAGQGLPAAVVIDIGLPGMDGIATTRALRRIEDSLPVVVVSLHLSRLYEIEAAEAGVTAFIIKSEAADKLVPALASALQCVSRTT